MEPIDSTPPMNLRITLTEPMLDSFTPIFGKGVGIAVRPGCSIRDVVCRQLGVKDDYLDHRVQTIFLDGRAVDDVDAAMIRDGAKLALSAAMPGLVGATMRKGGFYAAMRKEISHDSACEISDAGNGVMTLKLFNMVLKELGPMILAHGILLSSSDVVALFSPPSSPLREKCLVLEMDGREVAFDRLASFDWQGGKVHLKIVSE